ncbi:uncharacterized protein LOC8260352 isoform X3 [Ricinus communis]|uniref:uncharacterized protein LOC8260352 isoform X3 n=1 Tax=Ricinus communis TaxID=3988 RepID=UPI00201AF4C8|nr:uncharacterized protein LOC8260352 isoform X3 [Ricinus communis]
MEQKISAPPLVVEIRFKSLLIVAIMSETSVSWVASADLNKAGPDYFSFYTGEVKSLLSQDEDFLPFAAELSGNKCGEGEVRGNVIVEPSSGSFLSSVGAGLSDHKKERLKSLLLQALAVLTPEADESQVRSRKMGATSECEIGQNKKRSKMSSSSSTSFSKPASPVSSESCREVDDDLHFLLQSDASLVEETIRKYSDQLFATLSCMEKQLEELLDNVVSTCRPMTLIEKKHLQKLIQKLPPKNLNRVVEIVQHSKPEAQSCEEIFIDLELEDNIMLWRLYYYIEAVEKAKKLSL